MTGYDGSAYDIGDRVELHPSLQVRGARFAIVVGTSLTKEDRVRVHMDGYDTIGVARLQAGREECFRKA